MGHLNDETLARLVDEAADAAETAHLAECAICSGELEALRAQTEALGALPEIVPPKGDWRILEARLRSEGLIEDPAFFTKMGLAQTPTWMKVAAALVLYLGGTGTGMALASGATTDPEAELASAAADPARFTSMASVDEAAVAFRVAEQNYMNAAARYRELMLAEEGGAGGVDPLSKYAALEHLAAASQAALRQAPADPFFNGLLASVLSEREATARMVSRSDNWY